MKIPSLVARDKKHVWHPCAQMKDYELFPAIEVVSAEGAWIKTREGQKLIDATSSWWCKSLGHQHPVLKTALLKQVEKFEHVMFAHTTHVAIVELSEKLAQLTHSLNKVMYASDGSCAVEMAMKMSLHVRKINGEKRYLFAALENGYHGETLGALSVSDIGLYKEAYQSILSPTLFIKELPYVNGMKDPLWNNCESHWEHIVTQLDSYASDITAIIVEPILQAAGGMRIISQDFFKRLRAWTKSRNIHLIADEIMTGLGRTGKMLGVEHAMIEPDFLCLSKGLTSGWLPLSAMLTTQAIYDVFYDDYVTGKSFLHSHTHSGNALATSIALQVLTLIEKENLCERANEIGFLMRQHMLAIADETKKIHQVRQLGAMVAADLVSGTQKRQGFDFYRLAAKYGALMRPLGHTIYWVPPLTIEEETLSELKNITWKTLSALPN